MSGVDRCREYAESLVDWICIEKIPLEKIIYGITTFDFLWSLILCFPSAMAHFLYVNPGGVSSFLQYKWVNHVDIYRFRRFQPWELEETIDWDHELLYVNSTRVLMDRLCSRYEKGEGIPGDPGDYLKDVAGKPWSSGYNSRLAFMVNLWAAAVCIVYLSTPMLLLSIWWRKRRSRIIFLYMFFQIWPLFLLVSIGGVISENLMCATDIAYGHVPMRTYIQVIVIVFTIYQLIKYIILFLYMIERHLTHRRKDHGFPTKRIIRKTVKVPPTVPRGRIPLDHMNLTGLEAISALLLEESATSASDPETKITQNRKSYYLNHGIKPL